MGNTTSTREEWQGQCQRIAIFGLSGAGKTSLLNRWISNGFKPAVPTIGCTFEQFVHDNIFFMVWDVSGQSISSWSLFIDAVDSVVFVVDASDHAQLDQVHRAFQTLTKAMCSSTKCLVIANKQDQPHALSCHQLETKLQLDSTTCSVHGCSAVLGTGVNECLSWLHRHHSVTNVENLVSLAFDDVASGDDHEDWVVLDAHLPGASPVAVYADIPLFEP